MNDGATASLVQLLGAGGFGAIIGWYIYFINRYRQGPVTYSDLVTVIGIIGGTAVLRLFPEGSDLFGAYGIGLFLGFFGYYATLRRLVDQSENFDVDWFLDGRSRKLRRGQQPSPTGRGGMAGGEEEERGD